MTVRQKTLKLLPHQFELFRDTTSKVLGLVSGFGAGKTFILARKAVQLAVINAGSDIICTEPTYPLIDEVLVPELKTALEEFGIAYRFNISKSRFDVIINGKRSTIFCKSMENHKRLIGTNAAAALCDEFDTSDPEIAYKAYKKLIGRLRGGKVRQLVICSTPEGFRAMYRVFVEETSEMTRLIRARTQDNPHLPDDYIETMLSLYPEDLIKAYLNGHFVNLAGNNVYTHFDRANMVHRIEIDDKDDILIGLDFNIGGCVATHAVEIEGVMYVFHESVHHDTFCAASEIRAMYPNQYITIIPDASAAARQTNAAQSDIDILREADLIVTAPKKNPRVKDRINSVNNAFDKGLLSIDPSRCPKLMQALERQCYDDKGNPEKVSGPATIDDYNDSLGYMMAFTNPIIRPSFRQYK